MSLKTRILTETLKFGSDIRFRVCLRMSATTSGVFRRQEPIPSKVAQRCGHPQLRSIPLQSLFQHIKESI
jgi:hypothetical protein